MSVKLVHADGVGFMVQCPFAMAIAGCFSLITLVLFIRSTGLRLCWFLVADMA